MRLRRRQYALRTGPRDAIPPLSSANGRLSGRPTIRRHDSSRRATSGRRPSWLYRPTCGSHHSTTCGSHHSTTCGSRRSTTCASRRRFSHRRRTSWIRLTTCAIRRRSTCVNCRHRRIANHRHSTCGIHQCSSCGIRSTCANRRRSICVTRRHSTGPTHSSLPPCRRPHRRSHYHPYRLQDRDRHRRLQPFWWLPPGAARRNIQAMTRGTHHGDLP